MAKPMTQTDPVLIGVDIGTSSVKAVMVGADGTQLDRLRRLAPYAAPGFGAAEQDPNDWMRFGRARP
jgi:xylulokinase